MTHRIISVHGAAKTNEANEASLLSQLPVKKVQDYRDATLLVDRVGGVLEIENYSVVDSFLCPRK